ncbi:alpha/beta hydrolase [uncultured Aliiroseovarius sp.]|uniref:alpha/beta hydrolase n=1 Tax=uncultured Aliiroseovarius sp. TaxID=1658783 RepID=UPI002612035E|nr:alpha/beta hydrolase [uncultured Aliiroseovarius sp.]
MKRHLLSIAMALMTLCVLTALPATAQSLEQRVFYQFNPKRENPKQVSDKRLDEVIYKGLVLWVSKPKPGKPTVFYLHGSGGNLALRAKKFPWFLERGYGLVAMAYPGSSGSAGTPERYRIQKLATELYQDLPKFVGDSRIILLGESLGTGVAIELAAHPVAKRNPPLGIVLQSPYTSLLDLVRYKNPAMLPLFMARTDLWPSKRVIGRVKTPLFIMHGAKDTTVPVSMGRELYRRSASANKKLVVFPSADHGSIWRVETRRKLRAWIEKLY